jgi:hypothetical protein
MKILFSCVIPVFTILTTGAAYAKGVREAGNGGGALICAKPEDNELLDLWEASLPGFLTKNGLSILRSAEPVEVQVQAALKKLSLFWFDVRTLQATYLSILADKTSTKPGQVMPPPGDAYNEFEKEGCSLRGVAKYMDEQNILWFDPRLVSSLPSTDQAALWVHEVAYKLLRKQTGASDSREARKIVGYLFADLQSLPKRHVIGEWRDKDRYWISGMGPSLYFNPLSLALHRNQSLSLEFVDLTNDRKCGIDTKVSVSMDYLGGNDRETKTTVSGEKISLDLSGMLGGFPSSLWIRSSITAADFPQGCVFGMIFRDLNGEIVPGIETQFATAGHLDNQIQPSLFKVY